MLRDPLKRWSSRDKDMQKRRGKDEGKAEVGYWGRGSWIHGGDAEKVMDRVSGGCGMTELSDRTRVAGETLGLRPRSP